MEKEFKVFVGYFNSRHSRRNVGEYLFSLCPAARRIAIMTRRIGSAGRVYCCCIVFPSNFRARRAIKVLSDRAFDGMGLIARSWVERSAANERRDINWRSKPWEGEERRRRERRHYRHTRPGPAAAQAPFAGHGRARPTPRPHPEPQSETVHISPSELSDLQSFNSQSSLLESELQEMGIFSRREKSAPVPPAKPKTEG